MSRAWWCVTPSARIETVRYPLVPSRVSNEAWVPLILVGGRVKLQMRELSKRGARPFIVGAVGEIVIALITLGLVFGAEHWYHL